MNSKTYHAPTMAAALAEVKRDLGRDAVILKTRSFRKGGLLGLIGGRSIWEVTASSSGEIPPREPPSKYIPEPSRATGKSTIELIDAPTKRAATATVPTQPSVDGAAEAGSGNAPQDMLCRQVEQIRRMVESLASGPGKAGKGADVPPELLGLHTNLLGQDLPESIATELIREVKSSLSEKDIENGTLVRRALVDRIARRIAVAECDLAAKKAGRAKVIAVIGPTGAGKTTTIAKLAATYKLRDKKRVGLITVDTYRIAAVDQLRTYADIIEVPLRTVLTAGELHQAIHAMRDLDVVLIDTAGRSQKDHVRLSQLRGFLTAAAADEVHLVVSAIANPSVVRSTLERFLPLGANRVIISKVDEAETFGMILNVATRKVALSYITTGQDVPDDLAPARAQQLACWIAGESADES